MKSITNACCFALLAVASSAAVGQVTRCVDPVTKKVSYTNTGCPTNTAQKVVARESTPEELRQQELDALQGRLRFHREQHTAAIQRIDDRRQERSAATSGGAAGMSGNSGCKSARRNVEVQDSSISRRGVPHAALDAMDAACGGYTLRAPRMQAERDREREAKRRYAPAAK